MQTYTGGCHCGRFQYEAQATLDSVMSCNCSHCGKKGFLLKFIPAEFFTLTAGAEKDLSEYRFNKKHISHLFCPICGVQSFGRGKGANGHEMIALNVRCLDGIDPEMIPVTKFDGKNL